MRSAGNLHPEWGYGAPEPSFMRTARVALVATVIGAIGGAAVVVSLVQPGSNGNNTPIAPHVLVTGVPLATTPAAPAKTVAQEPDHPNPAQANASSPEPDIVSASKPSAAGDAREPNGTMTPTGAPTPGGTAASPETLPTTQAAVASPPATARTDAGPETSPKKSTTKKSRSARSDDRKRWGRVQQRRLFDQYGGPYGQRGFCCGWQQDRFGSMQNHW
jgi:hypothetical protein